MPAGLFVSSERKHQSKTSKKNFKIEKCPNYQKLLFQKLLERTAHLQNCSRGFQHLTKIKQNKKSE
jgi:acetyl-CoA carboxylase beta subunit